MFAKIRENLNKSDTQFLSDAATADGRLKKIEKLQIYRYNCTTAAILNGLSFTLILLIEIFSNSSSGPLVLILAFLTLGMIAEYIRADLQIKMLLLYEKNQSE